MRKKLFIYIILLLIVPISLCIFFGINNTKVAEDDIVINEANNAEKLDVTLMTSNKYTYMAVFSALFLMGCLYLYVAKRKE